jgi:hypothetical protein
VLPVSLSTAHPKRGLTIGGLDTVLCAAAYRDTFTTGIGTREPECAADRFALRDPPGVKYLLNVGASGGPIRSAFTGLLATT